MPPKFVPMPLPPSLLRHTPVKSMKPTGVMYASPMRNWSGEDGTCCLSCGLAVAAVARAPATVGTPALSATVAFNDSLLAFRSETVELIVASLLFTSADVLTASVAFEEASAARALAAAAASRALPAALSGAEALPAAPEWPGGAPQSRQQSPNPICRSWWLTWAWPTSRAWMVARRRFSVYPRRLFRMTGTAIERVLLFFSLPLSFGTKIQTRTDEDANPPGRR